MVSTFDSYIALSPWVCHKADVQCTCLQCPPQVGSYSLCPPTGLSASHQVRPVAHTVGLS
jgi:hypothetical protein